jgi:DNA-binding NarL/FixJ family response regulator
MAPPVPANVQDRTPTKLLNCALIGREVLLERLQAAATARQSVVLVGEAGIGKTAVLETVRSGVPSAFGRAIAALQWVPYLPLANACGRDLSGPPADVVAEVASLLDGELLILEDLHWADADTLDALPELASHVPIIASIRNGEESTAKAIAAVRDFATIVEVEPLTPAAAYALAYKAAPSSTKRELAQAVRDAKGNPLLLTTPIVGAWQPHGVRPQTGVERIEALVRRASPAARRSLARLALSGRSYARRDVAAADELENLRLLVDDSGICRPRHDLFGAVAVRLQPGSVLADIHRELASENASDGERARHLLAAGEHVQARCFALRAAAAAGSDNERADHYVIAASTVIDPSGADLCLDASEALLLAGRTEEALEMARRVTDEVSADPLRRVTALARAAWWSADYALAQQTIARGLELAEGRDEAAEVALRVLHARYLTRVAWDANGALTEARRAVELAERIEHSRAEAYGALGAACTLNGDAAARTWLQRSLDWARSENAFAVESSSADTLSVAELLAGDPRQMLIIAEGMIDRARARGAVTIERQFRKNSLVARFHCLDVLEEVVDEARALSRLPLNARQRDHVESHLVLALADLGEDDEATLVLATASGFAAHDQTSRAMILWANAEADFSAGRFLEAMASATECRTLAVVGFPAQVMVEPVRQWSALELGRDPGAAMADVTFPNLDGAKLESAAIAAMHETPNDPENVDRFLDAATAWIRVSLRGAFRCRWAAGEAAHRAGSDERARELLYPLEVELRMNGRRPLLRRVHRTLRAADAHVRPIDRPHVGPLTAAETEVLELVARGLDTKGIAARLLLRETTVEGHVRAATAKLDVSTRLAASIKMLRMNVNRQPVAGQRVVVAPAAFLDAACATFTRKQEEYTLDALPPQPWQLTPEVVVRATLHDDDDVQMALLAAVRGAALAVAAGPALPADGFAAFLSEVTRLGCEVGEFAAPEVELDAEMREALELLANGASVAATARSLFVSERTLHRRLAALRHRLGASTNASVAQLVLGDLPPRS